MVIVMRDETLQEIRSLEAELNYLIRPNMTTAEKIQALEKSFWRSHNAGFCDYIAGMLMGGIENGETEQHDLDCKYKWEVSRLLDILKGIEE